MAPIEIPRCGLLSAAVPPPDVCCVGGAAPDWFGVLCFAAGLRRLRVKLVARKTNGERLRAAARLF